jgi:hypothetical protein
MFKLSVKIFLLVSLVVVLIIIGIFSGIINISKINNNPGEKIFLSKIGSKGNFKLATFDVNYVVKDTIKNDTSETEKIHKAGKVLAIINGRIDACIDLKEIEINNTKENNDTAFISLPMPSLCSAEINYNNSFIYDQNFSPENLNQNMVDKYFPNTINNLKAEAVRMGILDIARENAVQILQPLIKQILKKNTVLKFEEN